MLRTVRACACAAIVLACSSSQALAQAPGATQSAPAAPAPGQASSGAARGAPEIEAGVAIVNRVGNKGESWTYGPGWHVGASYPLARGISLIALLTADYDKADGYTANIYTYAGGARFQSTRDSRVRPFGQVVFGGGQDNGIGAQAVETNYFPTLTPGAGVDLGLNDKLAVRVRFDVPILMKFSDSYVGTRVSVGVSLGFGDN